MSDTTPSPAGVEPDPNERTLLGHPSGLFVLFFAELWERFCFYGMRALLVIYLISEMGRNQADAALVYGSYTALVYATGIFGGFIADRILGYRRSILLGGSIMAAGEFMLMVPDETVFLFGLATIVVGNGLFKPNISAIVGKLYKQGDIRRDSGFTIFYMGINLGAFLAPILCQVASALAGSEGRPDYRYGFLVAGIGMLFGLVTFGGGTKLLLGQGKPPEGKEGFGWTLGVIAVCLALIPVAYLMLTRNEIVGYLLIALGAGIALYFLIFAITQQKPVRERMFALLVLLACNVAFWASFEQAGNSLNLFAKNQLVAPSVGDWTMPFEWWQSVNAIFIVLLGPVFAGFWVWLARRNANPSIPTKFGFALVQVGLGFWLLTAGIAGADDAGRIPWIFLSGLYLLHTTGELCLSPVGLSMVTKLAPEKMTGLVMGAWFLSISMANYAAGLFSAIAGGGAEAGLSDAGGPEQLPHYLEAFWPIIYMSVGIGVGLLLISRLLNRWMHGVK